MIVNNTLSEINDSIVFTIGYPINGIETLTGFTDSVLGETATRFFKKEFRYTLDGIHFTDWIALTNQNVTQINISPVNLFQAEFRYTRVGTDETGLLTFQYVHIDYETTVECKAFHYFDLSIYKFFFDCFNDERVRMWCINVLRKLYDKGIVPAYIERGANQNANGEDKNYIEFWVTVSCYFSLIVNYSRAFENINNDSRLLSKFLDQRDFVTSTRQTMLELQYLSKNSFFEMAKRGTSKSFSLKSGDDILHGELARLIHYDYRVDEFIFESSTYIWNLDRHSPMYRGIDYNQCTKAFEKSDKIVLDNYPLVNDENINVVQESGSDVIQITGVSSEEASGIGFSSPSSITESDKKFLFNVDPTLSYELVMLVRGDAPFTVRLYGYTSAFTVANPSSINPSSDSNYAIFREKVSDPSKWHVVRVILFSHNQLTTQDELRQTSLGLGNNLRLSTIISKIGVEVLLDRKTDGNTSPTVQNTVVQVEAGESRVISLQDIGYDTYNDVENHPYHAITVTALTFGEETGTLLFQGIEIEEGDLPQTVLVSDIAQGDLVLVDTGEISYNIEIEFTAEDNQPQTSTENSVLLVKNIKFKLLSRPYGIGSVGGIPFAETWIKNRSGKRDVDIDSFVINTLLPYNILNHNNYL